MLIKHKEEFSGTFLNIVPSPAKKEDHESEPDEATLLSMAVMADISAYAAGAARRKDASFYRGP